jgi:prephenate dehydrogenase
MMNDKTLTIIGCGLIGGSIGMALRRRRADWRIACLDKRENSRSIHESGFADFTGTLDDASEVLPQSSLVILASPVEVILEHLVSISPHLASGAVVTDVAGTKVEVMERAGEVIPERAFFVGGHPIAGSENSGIAAADPLLFKSRVYAVCPQPDTPAPALLMVLDMVEDLMALPLTIEPEEHDRVLAMVSHVPQLLSIALMHAALEQDSSHRLLDMASGRAFLDLTRIAGSSLEPWKGIFQTNRAFISAGLDRLEQSLATVRKALDRDDLDYLWNEVSTQRRKMTPSSRPVKRKLDLRLAIDQYDERILKALSDRFRAVRRIGDLKADQTAPVYDPDRERRLMNARHEWGKALGIPTELIDDLFEVVLRYSKDLQST